jgi:hypothetical protein
MERDIAEWSANEERKGAKIVLKMYYSVKVVERGFE